MFIRCKFSSGKVAFNKKDFVISFNQKNGVVTNEKRTIFADPSNLISFSQISNALHVLMGVRPAPINRETFHKRNDYIDDMAKNAWIKIDNKYSYINKDGKECYYYEFTQGKKSPWNSNSSNSLVSNEACDNLPIIGGFVTWSSFRKRYYYLNRKKYDDAITTFEKLSGMSFIEIKEKYTFYAFITHLLKNPNNLEELQKLGERIDFKNITNLDCASSFTNAGCKTNLAILTINTNPTDKITLNGEVIYEINDEDVINALYVGNKMATFLDGGMIEIIEISDYITFGDEYLKKDVLIENGFRLVTKN